MAGKQNPLAGNSRHGHDGFSLSGRVVRWAYCGLVSATLPPYYAFQSLRGAAPARAFAERLGYKLVPHSDTVFWLHAASMGESRLALAMGDALRAISPKFKLVVTASTETGYSSLTQTTNGNEILARLPIDLPGCVDNFLENVRPAALMLVETEWWPNMLYACHRRKIPVFAVNAKVSPKSAGRYRLVSTLMKPLLQHVARWYVRSPEDAKRIQSLGGERDRMEVTGSLKLVVVPNVVTSLEMRAISPPVLIAGSTRPGEEEIILDAYTKILSHYPEARLWIAPRHPVRFETVAGMLRQSRFTWNRLSHCDRQEMDAYTQRHILLIDQMGRLSDLYALASVAFVGGSLVPVGGHNPVEPVAMGTPTMFGPHMSNQAEAAQSLVDADLGWVVQDAADIATRVSSVLADDSWRAGWLDRRETFFARKKQLLNHIATDIVSRLGTRSGERGTHAPNS